MNMEQWNRQGTPATPPESYGKRVWHIWGPIVIKWVIGIGVSSIAMGVLTMMYVMADQDAAMTAMQSEDQMMELYGRIMEKYVSFAAMIEAVGAVITIPIMWYFFHKDRVKERQMGMIPNKKAPVWKYGAGILMAAALSLGLNNLIIIGNLSAVSEAYESTMEALYSAPLLVQVISLAILVPISEELVFRGLLFKRLREKGTYIQAAMYSAVVFGLLHGNLVQMLYGFILGMMLSYLCEKYGSVKAPIAAHIAMNLLSVAATEFKLADWMMESKMRIGVITIVCAFIASTMFVFVQRIEEKPDVPGTSEENEGVVA